MSNCKEICKEINKEINKETYQNINKNDIKWVVSEIMVNLDDYDDMQEKLDNLDDEMDEITSRRKKNEKINEILALKDDISTIKSNIVKKWLRIISTLSHTKDIQNISDGDTYFMISVIRIKKEIQNMKEKK